NKTPVAYTANGRCDVQARTFDYIEAGNPRLYQEDVILTNTTSPVTSIYFYRTNSGGHGVIFAISGSAGGEFDPITFTGYNEDVIVEAGAQSLPPGGLYTTASMDNGTLNTGEGWYVKGFDRAAAATGLPPAGSTIASAAVLDHQFTLTTNYAANNVVYVDPDVQGTMIWATPSAHSALSFLASAGHGPVVVDYTVHYADLSSETGTFSVQDWFNGTPVAYSSNGRVDVNSGVFDGVNSGNPRLYTTDITLNNTASPVTSVDLSFDGANPDFTSVVAFFAVSGTGASIAPVIVTQPASFNTNLASTVQITAAVSGSTPLFYHWQKGSGSSFTNLVDDGHISGSATTIMFIINGTFSDDGYYRLVVTNAAGAITSSVAYMNMVSSAQPVTVPGDSILMYQGSSPAVEVVSYAIDGTTSKYLNFGANAFPPFLGPVGFVVTPAMGSTVVTGLRLFTANDSPERDPADYLIEGSNDGGATYTAIASGTVSLPDDRNAAGLAVNSLTEFNREINFPNHSAYTMYRFSCAKVKSNDTANSMQIGEVQLLGGEPSGAVFITYQISGAGQLQLQWSQGTLQSADNVAGPYSIVNGATSPYTVSIVTGNKFYRVQVQ
ncbi:MAG: Immunoglobulin I-set domain protein, partial [Verrucomicrobiales bacterium]|nr:Immunoglobulin I-set domain protein [Verrucomicrobiales bacterium]